MEPPVPDIAPQGEVDYAARLFESEAVLDDVDRALARIDDGTYGTCETCGAVIDDAVLVSSPTARACEAHLPFAERR